ncbi:MAG TPA: hypothetical protein DCY74_06675, partial [Clostridiales bacterium]|nr:hypothetical protein [Clostridiales bacterium]
MNILFAASECTPLIKTGGLGDVIQALPARLAQRPDCQLCIILPYYA